jgi:hypothetical protein
LTPVIEKQLMNRTAEDRSDTLGASHGPSWTVRALLPGDETGVVKLYREVFTRPLTAAEYRWKLLSQPAPFPNVWVAVAGERIVGHYACSILRFKLGDHLATLGQVGDLMTARDYRRQGVLTAVGTSANAAWTAAGVPFVCGLSYAGNLGSPHELLGWRLMFPFQWLRRPLRPERIIARRHRLPPPVPALLRTAGWLWNAGANAIMRNTESGIIVGEVFEAGPEFDRLWDSLSPHYEVLVVRDRAWVAHRFFGGPDQRYRVLLAERDGQPAGYLAFRIVAESGTGLVVDIFTAPDDSAVQQTLLRCAVKEFDRAGAAEARVQVAKGTRLEHQFRRAGFLGARGTLHASIVSLAETVPREALSDPERWFAQSGDFDVI